jgi:hypothetical protein
MRVLIIESNEAKIDRTYKTTSIVHVRNSVVIADYLNADLISVETEIQDVIHKEYDVIFCMYASGYMMYNKYVEILVKNKYARVFWLVNDHTVPDNILLRKWVEKCSIGYDMICNNKRESYVQSLLRLNVNGRYLNDWIEDWYVVNLNSLIFDTSFIRKVETDLFRSDKEDCVYYGTFREDRLKDMKRYNTANYGISTSTKNIDKYRDFGVIARFTDKLSWEKGKETLFNFKYSIYFEDEHTHSNYAFMANRYYECLMLDVLIFFDHRCNMVIEKSGYNIDSFMIVSNGEELNDKIKIIDNDNQLYERLLDVQRSNYSIILAEKNGVLEEIKRVVSIPKDRKELTDYERLEKKQKRKPEEQEEIDSQLTMFADEENAGDNNASHDTENL